AHACWIPDGLAFRADLEDDLIFIGVRHSHPPFNARTKLLDQINKHVPIKYINSTDWKERNLIWQLMPALYHSAKVVLDVSHFWDNWGYCSGRYWYTATLGA